MPETQKQEPHRSINHIQVSIPINSALEPITDITVAVTLDRPAFAIDCSTVHISKIPI